jgi:hypothetical protein
MTHYFSPLQRRLVIEAALVHIERFVRARFGTHYFLNQERLRAQFRRDWQDALATLRKSENAKMRRRG